MINRIDFSEWSAEEKWSTNVDVEYNSDDEKVKWSEQRWIIAFW